QVFPPSGEEKVTKTASRTIVTRSARTAIIRMVWPITVFVRFSSFNVGRTTPSEMVAIISVMKKVLSIKLIQASPSASKYDKIKINRKIIDEIRKLFGSFFPFFGRTDCDFFEKME